MGKEKGCTQKKGGQPGNVNALGNSGDAAPIRNQKAKTHGFYSKHMPAEAFEIMQDIREFSPIDLLWEQIQIQFTAIVRAQKIMFVENKDEMIKELKKKKSVVSDSTDIEEEEYDFQFAWDRHATFLNAQSRAMGELRSLIKQFEGLAHEKDERRLKLKQMRLNIDRTKAEVERLTDNKEDSTFEIIVKDKGDR